MFRREKDHETRYVVWKLEVGLGYPSRGVESRRRGANKGGFHGPHASRKYFMNSGRYSVKVRLNPSRFVLFYFVGWKLKGCLFSSGNLLRINY